MDRRGAISATIAVDVMDDLLVEDLETVTVMLTGITAGDAATTIKPVISIGYRGLSRFLTIQLRGIGSVVEASGSVIERA